MIRKNWRDKTRKLGENEEINGELVIDNFSNLEKIWLVSFNNEEKLTKLKIINCPNLNSLNCWHNELVELKVNYEKQRKNNC